jgi:hypothetical protein
MDGAHIKASNNLLVLLMVQLLLRSIWESALHSWSSKSCSTAHAEDPRNLTPARRIRQNPIRRRQPVSLIKLQHLIAVWQRWNDAFFCNGQRASGYGELHGGLEIRAASERHG